MHFTTSEVATKSVIWNMIIKKLASNSIEEISSATSSFIQTPDGIECLVRKKNGELIARVYSESDRMGNKRWSFEFD